MAKSKDPTCIVNDIRKYIWACTGDFDTYGIGDNGKLRRDSSYVFFARSFPTCIRKAWKHIKA